MGKWKNPESVLGKEKSTDRLSSHCLFSQNGDAPNYDNGQNANVPSGFTTKDWHAYTIDWSPSRLNFEIDGTVVRTLERSSTKNSAGAYDYPSTPSRIQLGIWDSDGSPPVSMLKLDFFQLMDVASLSRLRRRNADFILVSIFTQTSRFFRHPLQGMVYWTGGSPNWSQADSHGEFTAEFKSLDIQCNDPSHIDSGDTAYQWSKTMSKTYGQPKVLGTKKSSVVN